MNQITPKTRDEHLLQMSGAFMAELLASAFQIPPSTPEGAQRLADHLRALVEAGGRHRNYMIFLAGAAGAFDSIASDTPSE